MMMLHPLIHLLLVPVFVQNCAGENNRTLSRLFLVIIMTLGGTSTILHGQVDDEQNKSDNLSYEHFTKISKEDLATKYFYIPDSSEFIKPENSCLTSTRIDKFGDNRKAPDGLRTTYPYRFDGDLIGTSRINTNLICIPFYGGIDEESTLFTFWRIENDSFLFDHLYQDIFGTKYARMKIDTVLTLGSANILIGITRGGEGGEMWKEIWIAKESSYTRVKICQSYVKGWHSDSEITYSLDYDLTGHFMNIEIVEHLLKENHSNTWDTISSRTVLNEKIDLTTIVSMNCH